MIKEHINELFEKEMSRKEFVQYVGSSLLIVFGISGLLKSLSQLHSPPRQISDSGYGSSAYGGTKKA
ncbi:hypothetical protein KC968_01755 [Candidatus Saccharibacteria bacterium]|nr:hypothetical protein [Candidatus Saccharibacteria bacterium]